MEVTKKNFELLLPEITQAIDDCAFLAIDTEFTGLYNSKTTEHAFDTMKEKYSKIQKLCSKFLITQIGMSTFKYHPDQQKYTHKDYNFYIFPSTDMKGSPDPRFICQSSSINFLSSFNFDFNKVFYEGIPYLTPAVEERMRNYIENTFSVERNALDAAKAPVQKITDISDEQKTFLANVLKQVDSFLADDNQTEMTLDPCNGFYRKLIYDEVNEKYPCGIDLCTKTTENNQKQIGILKCTNEEKLKLLAIKEAKNLEELETNVGFRKVLEHISKSNKLVLGHHMYLDILHIIEQFFYPLPEDLQDFKEMTHALFPRLADTKVIATSEKLKPYFESTSLNLLLKGIQEQKTEFNLPSIDAEDGYKCYNLDNMHLHEAGFDAFLCGVCFIALSRKLGSMNSSKIKHVEPSSKILSSYVNRFFIYGHHDIPFVNICGPDPEHSRNHVFYISFPKEWKTVDLVELFQPYGQVNVHWLNDESAFVSLKNKENHMKVKSALLKKLSSIYRIMTYADYQKTVQQPDKLFNDDTKRKFSQHSVSKLSVSSNLELIPEVDADEEDKTSNSVQPPLKKLKPNSDDDKSENVSSSSAVFEEENDW